MIKKFSLLLGLVALIGAGTIPTASANHTSFVCSGASTPAPGSTVRKVLVPEGATCTLANVTVDGDVLVLKGGNLSVLGSTIGDDLRADNPASIRVDCAPASGTDTTCSDKTLIDDDVVVEGTTGLPANPQGGNFSANYICDGTTIGGDVRIEEATTEWRIGGGFCTVGSGNDVGGNTIEDDVRIESNSGTVSVENNNILDDVRVEENSGPVTIRNNDIDDDLVIEDNTGGVIVQNNRIGDDLRCEDNNPPPTTASTNPALTQGNRVGDDAEGECSGAAFTTPPTA